MTELGQQGTLALTRLASALGSPGGEGSLTTQVVPTIELDRYMCEFEAVTVASDPGGTGAFSIKTIPVGEIWKLYAMSFQSATTTVDYAYVLDVVNSITVPLEILTTARTDWAWSNAGGILVPSGWRMGFNVAAHTAETSQFRAYVCKYKLPTPGTI